MKKLLKYISLSISAIALLWGCEKGPDFKTYTYPEQTTTGISPASGFATSYVTIKGNNFGTLAGAVKVYFGGILATNLVSVINDQIVVQVPSNAVSGKVSLSVWTNTIDSVGTYTVLPLPVTVSDSSRSSIAPIIAAGGDTVDIKGANFLTDPTQVTIDFNGVPAAKIVTLTAALIQVIAPASYTAGKLNVTFSGFKITCPTALAPGISKGDISIIFLKNYMPPFTTNNMTSAQGFNGSNWGTPDYWTVNSAAQNQLNGGATQRCGGLNFGKPNKKNIGELCLQAGWSDAIGNVLTNGKMYQTITLPAGDYRVDIEVVESGFQGYPNSSNMYLVVANGSTLPDLASPGTAPAPALATLGVQNGVSYGSNVDKSLTFTLTQNTQVSIGFVATMVANSYVRLNYLKLNLL